MNRLTRNTYITISLLTALALFFEVWWSAPLFESHWLSPQLIQKWQDGALMCVLLIALGFAGTGLFVGFAPLLLSPLTRRPGSLFHWVVGHWTGLVLADLFVHFRLHQIYGNKLNLDILKNAVETPTEVMVNLWQWMPGDLLFVLLSVPAITMITAGILKLLNRQPEAQRVHQVAAMGQWLTIPMVAIAALGVIGLVMMIWPRGHKEVTRATTISYPIEALIAAATDFDQDGWGYLDSPPDSKPFDPSCRPFAVDIPDDGLDQDLIGGDLRTDQLENWEQRFGQSPKRPMVTNHPNNRNVVVVFMESVRFDALEKTIDGQTVMANLQREIKQGALAPRHAFATQGFTYSSVKQFLFGGFLSQGTTVIDDFKKSGYQVGIFSGYMLADESFGKYLKGDVVFDPTKDRVRKSYQKTTPAGRLVNQMDRFFANRAGKPPFFAFTFMVDPHFPYKQVNPLVLAKKRLRTSQITAQNRRAVERVYYNQVYHVDLAAGQLLASLRRHRLLENTTVIFISDHGESLFDDGATIGHGIAINDVMTHLAMVAINPVVNIPDTLTHLHLRRLLHDNISGPIGTTTATLRAMPDRKLFQYTGSLRYPHEIGLWSKRTGRIIYKIPSNKWSTSRGEKRTKGIPDQSLARELVNKWELLLLEQANAASQV